MEATGIDALAIAFGTVHAMIASVSKPTQIIHMMVTK
ncbi:hypothetical protein [Veillonella sp.]